MARSVVYFEPKPKPDDTIIANLIYDIWFKNPEFGVRRMTDKLRLDGLIINKKKVSRLYHQMGLQAIYPKPRHNYNQPKSQKTATIFGSYPK